MREAVVEQAVKTYFTDLFPQFDVSQQCEIQFGTKHGIADVVLHQPVGNEQGRFVAIAECKVFPLPVLRSGARAQLKSYMSATNTRYGVLAVGTDPRNWEFCENKYNNWFAKIKREEFEKGIENWRPVSVGSSEINRQREQKIVRWWQRSVLAFLNLFLNKEVSNDKYEYRVWRDIIMQNTVIITEDGHGVNTKDFWGYALQQYYDPGDHDDVGFGTRAESSGLRLVACRESEEDNVLICAVEGDDYKRATRMLNSLLVAVKNGERIWDVKENEDYVISF